MTRFARISHFVFIFETVTTMWPMGAAQIAPSAVTLEGSVSRLTSALVQDRKSGDIEAAVLHKIQLEIALVTLRSFPDSVDLQAKLRAQFVEAMQARPAPFAAKSPVPNSELVSVALDLQNAVALGDLHAARDYLDQLGPTLLQTAMHLREETLNSISTSSNAEWEQYKELTLKVVRARRSDDVPVAESYAPRLLQEWMKGH